MTTNTLVIEKNFDDIENWQMLDIITFSMVAFPKAEIHTQLARFNAEKKELEEASTLPEQMEEAADMFIVACGLARWDYGLFEKKIRELPVFLDNKALVIAINSKMKKNVERLNSGYWIFKHGQYIAKHKLDEQEN